MGAGARAEIVSVDGGPIRFRRRSKRLYLAERVSNNRCRNDVDGDQRDLTRNDKSNSNRRAGR